MLFKNGLPADVLYNERTIEVSPTQDDNITAHSNINSHCYSNITKILNFCNIAFY